MDIYSSGLALLSIGLPVKRWVGTTLDGIIMTLGTIATVWFSPNFVTPFEAFLTVIGVPIAAWGGIFLADLLLRRKDYDEKALYDPNGRYGSVNWLALGGLVVASIVGWGLITSAEPGFTWLGYLFNPLHLDIKVWGGTSIGVVVALVIGFIVPFLNIKRIRKQETEA